MAKQSRFKQACIRNLQNPPQKACPSALLRIELVKLGKREVPELPGCPFYINDALSCYCWFNYADQKEFSFHTTKEIGQFLALTSAQVEKAENSALEKVQLLKNSEEIQEIRECVADLNYGNTDDTIYAVGSFTSDMIEELNTIVGGKDGKKTRRKKDK